ACARTIYEALSGENNRRLASVGLLDDAGKPRLMREKHVTYLQRGLASLSAAYVSLDASRPWLCYWILHSLDLLDALPSPGVLERCCETLERCQNTPEGGFGGGPQQLSHCAPTYAAILALCLIGSERALTLVDRCALYSFFLAVKDASGGFRMHDDGEVDVRGTYTVVAVAALLNMLTPQLAAGVAEYVLSCRSYEGGFGGEPGNEAHGGYVFCALATLVILDRTADVNLDSLERWLCRRQMTVEGGFQGRANKLVDGCYSFWQGATLAIVERLRRGSKFSLATLDFTTTTTLHDQQRDVLGGAYACDELALQQYILLCGQQLPDGGLRDKPGKPRDYYHTCYCLSGLAAVQHFDKADNLVYGSRENIVRRINPVFNIRAEKVRKSLAFFSAFPSTHGALFHSP
ncbi:hypothetical protein CTAYLR_000801, partial [Chrysophaeum taylorii]